MPQHRTQSKTTCLLKKKVAEGHLLKYKTCTQRLNFQRIQDLPQLINKKPTQNTKQNRMLLKKESGRRPPSKVQDMPSTTKLTKKTRHVPTAEHETKTEHKAKPRGRLKVIQDMPRLMNKKPTQNTKQNHMSIKKEGGRRPPSKVQDMPPTINSSKIARHAPTDEPETNTEHKTKPYAWYKKGWPVATFQSTRHVPNE
jgi:hypothetical protein